MTDRNRKPTRDAEGSILKKVEERRTIGGKVRKETVYYARVRMNEYDEQGRFVRSHERKRRADSYNDAVILRRSLRLEIKSDIAKAKLRNNEPRIYFFDLLEFYERHYVKEAVFSGTKKIAGQRSPLRHAKRQIESFRDFFGNVPVADITYARIFEYKLAMQATRYKRLRKIEVPNLDPASRREYRYFEEWHDRKPATVHRYLAALRRILSVGVQQGFAETNPFKLGDPLIETAIEETRVRVCTFEEEELLYSVCVPPRDHLKKVIICAIDTFARAGELFSLIGSDVDFETRSLTIREMNAKTLRSRTVPLTDRAFETLLSIRDEKTEEAWKTERVFGVSGVYRAWYTALALTEIEDLHFHDLRGTGITRMLDAGVPAPMVMKFSGHRKYETFMKYVKNDLRVMQDAAAAMSLLYRKRKTEIAKGQRPLAKGHETSPEDEREVTEIGDAIN